MGTVISLFVKQILKRSKVDKLKSTLVSIAMLDEDQPYSTFKSVPLK